MALRLDLCLLSHQVDSMLSREETALKALIVGKVVVELALQKLTRKRDFNCQEHTLKTRAFTSGFVQESYIFFSAGAEDVGG